MATANDPTVVSIKGRLSYPVWEHSAAVARNLKSKFPKSDPKQVRPEFNLLLTQEMLDVLVDHLNNTYLPYVERRGMAGETKNALDAKAVKKLNTLITTGQTGAETWADLQPPHIIIKDVPPATKALAPECVAMVKVVGPPAQDITQKAIVNSVDELLPAYQDRWTGNRGVFAANMTVHDLYPGAYVAATLNLYAFMSGKEPGIQASAASAIFTANADRFGGGVDVDEDGIFAVEDA